MGENVTFESWAMLTVARELDITAQMPNQSWLQMTSPAPGGSTCIQDILASFLYWRETGMVGGSELRWGMHDQTDELMSALMSL